MSITLNCAYLQNHELEHKWGLVPPGKRYIMIQELIAFMVPEKKDLNSSFNFFSNLSTSAEHIFPTQQSIYMLVSTVTQNYHSIWIQSQIIFRSVSRTYTQSQELVFSIESPSWRLDPGTEQPILGLVDPLKILVMLYFKGFLCSFNIFFFCTCISDLWVQ